MHFNEVIPTKREKNMVLITFCCLHSHADIFENFKPNKHRNTYELVNTNSPEQISGNPFLSKMSYFVPKLCVTSNISMKRKRRFK